MPQGHEREDCEQIHDSPDLAAGVAAHGNVDIAHDPAVEAAVPAAPESERAVAVGDAADHVFWRVDAVDQGPEAEEAPWYQ